MLCVSLGTAKSKVFTGENLNLAEFPLVPDLGFDAESRSGVRHFRCIMRQ